VAYLAAGTRRGTAQSIYQVGGNSGQALAPVITALVLVPLGQFGVIWFTAVAGLAVIFLTYIARWYAAMTPTVVKKEKPDQKEKVDKSVSRTIRSALIVLVFIIFARTWYAKAISNFYAFYAIDNYGVSIAESQYYIFTFLLMGAIGTFVGGPLADRFGKKNVILFSMLATAPLALLLPHIGSIGAIVLLGLIGFIVMSSFSVTVVYAQELIPNKIGTMSGLTVGLAFGLGAIGSVALGSLIDFIGLTPTMIAISLLPLLGMVTFLLPSDKKVSNWYAER
jgi:FSR family fosmidomycin resistance protein-like MFS transporter